MASSPVKLNPASLPESYEPVDSLRDPPADERVGTVASLVPCQRYMEHLAPSFVRIGRESITKYGRSLFLPGKGYLGGFAGLTAV
jgi:hypothetical protein